MTELYRRQIIVTVAGLVITEPRISVSIQRDIDGTQVKGEVKIYNLAPGHEQQIFERGREISIEAGYPQTVANIFEGNVQRVIRERADLARITKILLGDMVHDTSRLQGVFTESYAGEVPVRTIARDIITRGLMLTPGPLDAIPAEAMFNNFRWDSTAVGALSILLKDIDATWYEDNGVVRINRSRAIQADQALVPVNVDSGLIGTPSITDEGAEVRSFLNPRIVVGGQIEVRSETLSGPWKVAGLQVSADNWEGQFEMFCDLRSLDEDDGDDDGGAAVPDPGLIDQEAL